MDENFDAAIRAYDAAVSALDAGQDGPVALYLHRAAALFKVSRLEDSLEDANTALRLARAAGNTEQECVALYRKGYVDLQRP